MEDGLYCFTCLSFGHPGIGGVDLVDDIDFGEGHDGNSWSMEWALIF